MSVVTSYAHGQFSWVDLSSSDMSSAEEFYTKLFGWTVTRTDAEGGPPYAIFRLGGKDVAGIGELSAEMKTRAARPCWNSYVNVDDVADVMKKAQDLGAAVVVPAMQVADAGWLGYVRDPTGATVAFWQKGTHAGAGIVNRPASFCWNELATRDVEKAKSFYGELLGWSFESSPHAPKPYYLIKNGDSMNGGVVQMDEKAAGDSDWMVYFSVAHAETRVDKLVSLGGEVVTPPFDTEVGRIAVVRDPQGATFSFIAMVDPPK